MRGESPQETNLYTSSQPVSLGFGPLACRTQEPDLNHCSPRCWSCLLGVSLRTHDNLYGGQNAVFTPAIMLCPPNEPTYLH
ncbi:uncharacterized protein ARMOST_16043 [Armillaria ostoyae]|uniref:Uncharacterized protein n=1 Tax=Armillaria ostoyae TaxID=47428 RepID=A0A284RV31_ARMOS|nr:uncharacterized protein ARMOST_16043 [Armillaria ostoyae]